MGNTNEEVASRLRAIIQHEIDSAPAGVPGGPQRYVAEKTGLPQSYVSEILSGKKTGLRKLFDILDNLGLDITAALNSDVGMEPSDSHTSRDYGPIPLINWTDIAAGDLTHIRRKLVYSAVPISENAFALEVANDAMAPRYLTGDTIIIDPQVEVESGDVAVIEVRGEFILTKIEFCDDGGCTLSTTSPEYPDLSLPPAKRLKIGITGPVVDLIPKLK